MNEIEELQQNNIISNLPLLFANGYPTSLMKITEAQLEKFVPFMVRCSLGFINQQGRIICNEPEWWPLDLPFSIPLNKPKRFEQNWADKLKNIVLVCYQFHKSTFLLKFCNDLSAYEHTRLRFINNYNSTTSLYDRVTNKLLVTFRNENMSYDQSQRMRKFLLQSKKKNGQQPIMVEPPPFDIYLCDSCDAELYSEEAMLEHEKTCTVEEDDEEDEDAENEKLGINYSIDQLDNIMAAESRGNIREDNVITCDSPQLIIDESYSSYQTRKSIHLVDLKSGSIESKKLQNNQFNYTDQHGNKQQLELGASNANQDERISFLLNFQLQLRTTTINDSLNIATPKSTAGHNCIFGRQQQQQLEKQKNIFNDIVPKNTESNIKRKISRRNRTTLHLLNRSASMPISSPAGKFFLASTKSFVNDEYCHERLERMEKFCQPVPYIKNVKCSKSVEKRSSNHNAYCTYKRPADYTNRLYVFPTKRYVPQRPSHSFNLFNSNLLSKCRPISVRLKRITDINRAITKATTSNGANNTATKLNIKLTRDTTSSSSWKISSSNTVPESNDSSYVVADEDENKDDLDNDVYCSLPNRNTYNSPTVFVNLSNSSGVVGTEVIVDTINLCTSDEETDDHIRDAVDTEDFQNLSTIANVAETPSSKKKMLSSDTCRENDHENEMNLIRATFQRSSTSYDADKEMKPVGEQILRNISSIFCQSLMLVNENCVNNYYNNEYLQTSSAASTDRSVIMNTTKKDPWSNIQQQSPDEVNLNGNCITRQRWDDETTQSITQKRPITYKTRQNSCVPSHVEYLPSMGQSLSCHHNSLIGKTSSDAINCTATINTKSIEGDVDDNGIAIDRHSKWTNSLLLTNIITDSTVPLYADKSPIETNITASAEVTTMTTSSWFNRNTNTNTDTNHNELTKDMVLNRKFTDFEHENVNPVAVHTNGVISIDLTS